MNTQILEALKKEPVFSSEFTKTVRKIKTDLSSQLSISITHDANTNYSTSDRLLIYFDDNGLPVEKSEKGKYLITVFISSRDKFFAFIFRELKFDERLQRMAWMIIDSNELPASAALYFGKIREFLEFKNYNYLEGDVLKEKTEVLSELDEGIYLNVFEALFSELG